MPHSSYVFESMELYRSDPQYFKTEKYAVGSRETFEEPQDINNCWLKLYITYSTEENFQSKNVLKAEIYTSESITLPGTNSDKYLKYEGGEPTYYMYRAE